MGRGARARVCVCVCVRSLLVVGQMSCILSIVACRELILFEDVPEDPALGGEKAGVQYFF